MTDKLTLELLDTRGWVNWHTDRRTAKDVDGSLFIEYTEADAIEDTYRPECIECGQVVSREPGRHGWVSIETGVAVCEDCIELVPERAP